MRVVNEFSKIYKREPENTAFCSYRVCPIGAHVDHQFGKITGFAIDKGVYIAYAPKQNGVIELTSMQFDKRAQWHIAAVPKDKQGDWADYLRGATLMLAKKHPLTVGLCGVVEGSLPIGGLSSSAAVIIAFLSALCAVQSLNLSIWQNLQKINTLGFLAANSTSRVKFFLKRIISYTLIL